MLCNWSFWLYIGETGSKINCLPWWGNTRKTRYQRLFEVKGCLLGKNGKLNSTPPQTHALYIFSQPQNFEGEHWLQQLPQRQISEASTWGVSISDPWAHLEVFRGEWTQIHKGSPWGLPCSAQFEPPIISLEENGVEDEIVSMCIARKGKMYAREGSDCIIVCLTTTPCSVPLDTIFHRMISLSAAIILEAFRHFWTLTHCHPKPLKRQWLQHPSPCSVSVCFVSNNIWFWWCCWLHQH